MRIEIYKGLTAALYSTIDDLATFCAARDHVSLKLELGGKKSNDITPVILDFEEAVTAWETVPERGLYTEFLCYDEKQLIGYMGISNFGNSPLEVNGMVHPNYRRRGIFSKLFQLVIVSWHELENRGLLLLTDRLAEAGQQFVKAQGGTYSHTEYEMVLKNLAVDDLIQGMIVLRKATNRDAGEIAYQNSLYFCCDYDESQMVMPEDEEARGMRTYLAEYQHKIVGKVCIEVDRNVGGIYGLGVLPSYRGRSFSRIILQKAIQMLMDAHVTLIKLQVEANNEKALGLYQSVGFETVASMDYYLFSRPRV
jgi:ribosomal protein S18 acetylase RimI-like enzyme